MHLGSRRQKIWDQMNTSLNDGAARVCSAIVSRGDAIYIILPDIVDGVMKVFVSLYKMITEWHIARGICHCLEIRMYSERSRISKESCTRYQSCAFALVIQFAFCLYYLHAHRYLFKILNKKIEQRTDKIYRASWYLADLITSPHRRKA